jgi:hypothetical protein
MADKVGGMGPFHITAGDYYDDNTEAADFYNVLKDQFGSDVIWFAAMGNHEVDTSDVSWLRNHYTTNLVPRCPGIKNGPSSSSRTTYSWDYEQAHIVIIDGYQSGGDGVDGDEVDWLRDDLANNDKPIIFVCYHEPLFANGRGDKDDMYDENREFWQLCADYGVAAAFCAHTHVYGREKGGGNDFTWEIDAGNAGRTSHGDTHQTFIDVIVNSDGTIEFNTWQGEQGQQFRVTDSWTTEVDVAPDADFNKDGVVNFLDFALLLEAWLG